MADIPVKPKKTGTPAWLWILLVLVLAIAAWFAVDYFTDGDVGDAPAEVEDDLRNDLGILRPADSLPLALQTIL